MVIILSIFEFEIIFMCDDLIMMIVFYFFVFDIIEYEYNILVINCVFNLNII